MTEPTTLPAQHEAIRESLALHEALRRLNFAPDQIFVWLERGKMGMTVKRDGKQASFATGIYLGPYEQWLEAWNAAVARWNDPATPEVEREEVFRGSKTMRFKEYVVAAVLRAGFDIRRKS